MIRYRIAVRAIEKDGGLFRLTAEDRQQPSRPGVWLCQHHHESPSSAMACPEALNRSRQFLPLTPEEPPKPEKPQ